jgi:hypothetical protein
MTDNIVEEFFNLINFNRNGINLFLTKQSDETIEKLKIALNRRSHELDFGNLICFFLGEHRNFLEWNIGNVSFKEDSQIINTFFDNKKFAELFVSKNKYDLRPMDLNDNLYTNYENDLRWIISFAVQDGKSIFETQKLKLIQNQRLSHDALSEVLDILKNSNDFFTLVKLASYDPRLMNHLAYVISNMSLEKFRTLNIDEKKLLKANVMSIPDFIKPSFFSIERILDSNQNLDHLIYDSEDFIYEPENINDQIFVDNLEELSGLMNNPEFISFAEEYMTSIKEKYGDNGDKINEQIKSGINFLIDIKKLSLSGIFSKLNDFIEYAYNKFTDMVEEIIDRKLGIKKSEIKCLDGNIIYQIDPYALFMKFCSDKIKESLN